ncbi:hypothetical protein [Nocardia grenadensis]|uniref:hypothetical protein n=1 Tax=Nocardia grenadensis TaxID=931537 RepID=UPI0007A3C4FD|nr:hypothetical protein [Nocardia grenadensis]
MLVTVEPGAWKKISGPGGGRRSITRWTANYPTCRRMVELLDEFADLINVPGTTAATGAE